MLAGERVPPDWGSVATVRHGYPTHLDEAERGQEPADDDALNGFRHDAVDRWLPYQLLSSRLWSRTGYYHSGGASGVLRSRRKTS